MLLVLLGVGMAVSRDPLDTPQNCMYCCTRGINLCAQTAVGDGITGVSLDLCRPSRPRQKGASDDLLDFA